MSTKRRRPGGRGMYRITRIGDDWKGGWRLLFFCAVSVLKDWLTRADSRNNPKMPSLGGWTILVCRFFRHLSYRHDRINEGNMSMKRFCQSELYVARDMGQLFWALILLGQTLRAICGETKNQKKVRILDVRHRADSFFAFLVSTRPHLMLDCWYEGPGTLLIVDNGHARRSMRFLSEENKLFQLAN